MNREALLIATNSYADEGLQKLESPGGDAEQLAEVLSDGAIGGFDVRAVLLDEPTHVLLEQVDDFFAERAHDDLLFLYLSCHGVKDLPGRLYFATSSTRRERLPGTGIAASWLAERMKESNSRQIVTVLDCCHSGAIARDAAKSSPEVGIMDQLQMDEQAKRSRGRVVLTATDSIGYAFEADQVTRVGEVQSIFTRVLVDGLRTGEADLDGDRRITVNELYDYVYKRVCDETPNQTPGKCAVGLEQGEIVIAWHARTSAMVPRDVDLEPHAAPRPTDGEPEYMHPYIEALNEKVSAAYAGYIEERPPGRSYWAVQLAEALVSRGDNAGAEKAYRAALHTVNTTTETATAGIGLGDLLKRQGRHDEAAEAYRDVIAAGDTPERQKAWFSLAGALDELGRPGDVVATYREAADAGVEEAWLRLARYLARNGKYEDAADACHEATGVGTEAQRRDAWLELARISTTLGHEDDVVLSYTRAAELGEHKAWLMLADYYKRRGEPIQAAEAYRRAELVGHGAGLHIGRLRTARKARKALKALGELQQQS